MNEHAKDVTRFLLRVVVGLLFLQHGGQKLFGWFGGMGPQGGSVPLMSQMGLAGLLEFGGGMAILLGLFTRPVAFVLSGEMAVAYFTAHQPHGTWPIQNHGEVPVLFSFIFLFFAAHGAGAWSLDGWYRQVRAGTSRGLDVPRTERVPVAQVRD